MAWTAPMTFVANSVLTAAQLNTHLRDNLNECPTAKASSEGSYFVSSGPNAVVERFVQTARVAAYQNTTSTAFGDLSAGTVGPTVTCQTGTRALVFVGCLVQNNTADRMCAISWSISGATSRAALDATSGRIDGIPANNLVSTNSIDIVTDLTPGSNTFKAEYKVGSGTGTFGDRFIGVLPL